MGRKMNLKDKIFAAIMVIFALVFMYNAIFGIGEIEVTEEDFQDNYYESGY